MMTPTQFRTWRGKRSQQTAGALIGRTERQIRSYENGSAEIDLTVELACAAIENEIFYYTPKKQLTGQDNARITPSGAGEL